MRGRIIPVSALTDSEVEAWDDLARRALEPNPMCEPQCVLAAARHLTYGSEISLLVVEQGRRMLAATPLRRQRMSSRVPISVMTTDIRRMTWLGTPLLDPQSPVDACMEMLRVLSECRRKQHFSFFEVRWIAEGPVSSALVDAARRQGLPTHVIEDFEQPFMHRRAEGDYTFQQSKRHLSDYRRRARRLAELLGADLEVANLGGDPAAMQEYIDLEAAGYKYDSGVAMRTQDGESEYFSEMCSRFAADGRLHFLRLHAGPRTVAMQISLEAEDGLFLIKVTHDEEFNRYDPGVQLHLRAMEYFHSETKTEWIDICTFADNELLLRLYPDRRRTTSIRVGLGGVVNAAVLRSIPWARRLTTSRSESDNHSD